MPDQMEKRITDIEYRNLEKMQREGERHLNIKNERTLWELSDSIRKSNARIAGLPEGEEREKGPESLSNIYWWGFPNHTKKAISENTKSKQSTQLFKPRKVFSMAHINIVKN